MIEDFHAIMDEGNHTAAQALLACIMAEEFEHYVRLEEIFEDELTANRRYQKAQYEYSKQSGEMDFHFPLY